MESDPRAPAAAPSRAPAPAPTAAEVVPPAHPPARGWAVFGGTALILAGCFSLVEGLVALVHQSYYRTPPSGLTVHVGYPAWGWVHLGLALVAGAAGLGVLAGRGAARIAGVAVTAASAVVDLAFAAAAPVWSALVIGLDVVVLYALLVHGGDLRDDHRADRSGGRTAPSGER